MARRVVLAWERGGNLGHLARLRGICTELRRRGCETVWVVPDAFTAHAFLQAEKEVLRAPMLIEEVTSGSELALRTPHYSFADILLSMEFGDPTALARKVELWLRLLEPLKASAIVCDYAPAAQFAACLMELPTLQLSNGFDAPPADFPVYASFASSKDAERHRERSVTLLAGTIEAAAESLGMTLSLEAYLTHAQKMLDVIPETDPHGARAGEAYVGPFIPGAQLRMPIWSKSKDSMALRVFAYLRGASRNFAAILEALRLAQASTCCVWPEAPDAMVQRHAGSCIGIVREPVNLHAALGHADLVLNYGSSSVVSSTLLAGKAQLMVPADFEKQQVAWRVESEGAGWVWHPSRGAAATAVENLLHNRQFGEAAINIARRYPPEHLKQRLGTALDGFVARAFVV